MPRKVRPITPAGRLKLKAAIRDLKEARDMLRAAGCPRAAAAVARALKSADGARRHAERRQITLEA